ncbi:MAG: LysR substrate-binding domain-containing protein [Telluria sp.]
MNGLRKARNTLPPLNAIKAFESVARLRSLTLAAAELNVTPSAVSQQIRLLEEHIGKKLFIAEKKGLSLTEIAIRAFPDITQAVDLISRAFAPAEAHTSRVAISTLPALANRWLNSKLSVFMTENTELDLYIDSSPKLVDFTTESFDMALRFGRGLYEPLSIDPLFKERFQAVCSPLVKKQIEERIKTGHLDAINFICDVGMNAGEHVTWTDWLERRGLPPHMPERRIVCTDANMSIDAAVNGVGLLLGRHVLADLLEQGTLVALNEEPFVTSLGYFLVYPSFSGLSPASRSVRRRLQRVHPHGTQPDHPEGTHGQDHRADRPDEHVLDPDERDGRHAAVVVLLAVRHLRHDLRPGRQPRHHAALVWPTRRTCCNWPASSTSMKPRSGPRRMRSSRAPGATR